MMRKAVLVLAAIVGSCAAPPPAGAPRQAAELAGRTQGPAERCVLIQQNEALRISDSDRHTLLYGSGGTIWANHLGPSCGFGRDDALVTEPIGSYHCRGDLVRSFDRFTRIPGPACVLGEFIPFKR
jgi:hypothetical protein